MDDMVYYTQQWLNKTYGNDVRYNKVEENGKTGWATIYALTRALQIELGIKETADNFGPTSRSLYGQNLLKRNDGVTDNKYGILQGALWCKGYNPGHYYSEGMVDAYSRVFDESVENAIKELKKDAGFINPDGIVTVNVMAALLSMDAFVLLSAYGGDKNIRAFQQEMNRLYEDYIGIMPCDGVYGRNTNKALVYAIQAEEGLPISVANGNFGPTTESCCPTIPYSGVEKSYTGATYTSDKITNFTRLFKFGLYANGFGNGNFTGEIVTGNQDIKNFQEHLCIPETGEADLATWLSVVTSCGDKSRTAKAADCATIIDEAKAQTLVKNGYEIIGRYLTGYVQDISKALTSEEIQIIFNSGLSFFPIYQTTARSEEYFTVQQGTNDAAAARSAAENLGIPPQTIIYFAVDFDAMDYQITDSIIPYFKAVSESMGAKYKVGIYGSRNICSRVCAKGYAISSFVGDMSTGFSGNLGFKIPDNWAFDQFANVTIGTENGKIEIDKDGYSGRDIGVCHVSASTFPNHDDGWHNTDINPDVFINRSNTAYPVYQYKVKGGMNQYSFSTAGEIIGYIKPDEFYTRYHTGYSWTDPDIGKPRWYSYGDAVHRVCFRDNNGSVAIGYIMEELLVSEFNIIESHLPYQEPFHYYNVYFNSIEDKYELKEDTGSQFNPYTYDVKRPLPYYNGNGKYLGTVQPGEKLLLEKNADGYASSTGGLGNPWLMWFDMRLPIGESVFVNLNTSKSTGAFVSLGYEFGTMYDERAIW